MKVGVFLILLLEPKHFCLMFDKTHITRLGTFTSETNIKAAGAVCFEIRQFHNDKICKVVEAEVNGEKSNLN